MRKRTIAEIADTIFWYGLYFLPIIIMVVVYFRPPEGTDAQTIFYNVYYDVFAVISDSNIIYTTLYQLFMETGAVLPLFVFNGGLGDFCIVFGTWFISCYIIHLAVDFLLFIPRLCHKYMNKFCQNE